MEKMKEEEQKMNQLTQPKPFIKKTEVDYGLDDIPDLEWFLIVNVSIISNYICEFINQRAKFLLVEVFFVKVKKEMNQNRQIELLFF